MIEGMILGMTLIVFFSRYLFLEPRLPVQPGPKLLRFLSFSLPAVLSAVVAPMVLIQNQSLNISPLNPYVIGTLAVILVMRRTGKTLPSVAVGLLIFMICKALLPNG